MNRLRQVDIDWFAAGGVSPYALAGYLADPRETRIPYSAPLDMLFTVNREAVRFLRGRRFVRAVDCQGEHDDLVAAYLIPAIEGGRVVDWIAWHPRSGRLATLDGRAGLLGADALGRASRDEPLVVEADPRAWLAGWRRGVCVVDEAIARPQLLEAPAIQAADIEHGKKLKAMLKEVKLPRIVVPVAAIGTVAA